MLSIKIPMASAVEHAMRWILLSLSPYFTAFSRTLQMACETRFFSISKAFVPKTFKKGNYPAASEG